MIQRMLFDAPDVCYVWHKRCNYGRPRMTEENETRTQVDDEANEDLELEDKDAAKIGGGETPVSNVMKTKHDTAKNSISNVR